MRDSPGYTLFFAASVCVVCSIVVSASAVSLRGAQAANRKLDRQSKVLKAAGLTNRAEDRDDDRVRALYERQVDAQRIALKSGKKVAASEGDEGDEGEQPAPANKAGLVRIPTHREVYLVRSEERGETLVLPVEGKGLWSTMRGFLALDAEDLNTVRGMEFYEHGETPGLGGEIDNPRWKSRFRGRKAFDDEGKPALRVARGPVGSPEQDPHQVDALTGATITARGVSNLLSFWLGDDGYGPLLKRLEKERKTP